MLSALEKRCGLDHYTHANTSFGGRIVALIARLVFRYDGETCGWCGLPLGLYFPTWWGASDDLWMRVHGHPAGIRCPRCFTLDARAKGIALYWRPVVEAEVGEDGLWRPVGGDE